MGDGLRKRAVVGHEQQALAVLIQTAHRVQAGGDIAHQLHHGLAAQLVAGGGHIAAGLVQGQIVHLLILADIDALVVHVQHVAVGVHLVAHLDGVAVDLHAALGNDLFCRTAGEQTLFSHDLLNTFFCHNKTPCAPPGAQNAHLSPVLGCGCACIKTVSWKLTVTAIVVSRPAGSFLREQRRVAAPSSRFAIACVLLAAAPTATPCFRRWRRSLPLQGSSPAPTLARRGPTPRTFAGETICRPAGIGTGYSGKMREAMSKVQAATKIDRKARREVRGLAFAGGLASAGGTECPVPIPLSKKGKLHELQQS